MARAGRRAIALHSPRDSRPDNPRRDALLLLAVLGAGVFLAGLELMVTAVALPAIVADLAGWTRLREASWIINGYLLVSVVTMPLAGRLADLWGTRRRVPRGRSSCSRSAACSPAWRPTLELLIAARLVQAVGGGALVPVATSAASHLFPGVGRPRALGLIAALTFLGMAAGPFLGAAILGAVHPAAALSQLGVEPGLVPRQRAGARLALGVLRQRPDRDRRPRRRLGREQRLGDAAATGPPRHRRARSCSRPFLVGALGALTLLGSRAEPESGGLDPAVVAAVLAVVAVVAGVATVVRGLRVRDPFLDPRLFRHAGFASATVVSALTGYGFATAIVGGAVFVDRVLYGGPDEQRLALGALAGATAVGALASGFIVRILSLRLVTLIGPRWRRSGALVVMSGWTTSTRRRVRGRRAGGVRRWASGRR